MENHWDADLLDRQQDAEFLYNFLVGQARSRKEQGRTGSFVLNLDAEWGGGKSFFLQRFAREVEDRGHVVATVNAWRDDHADDPYIAIMAAIEKAFAPYIRKPGKVSKAWNAVKTSGGPIALNAGATIAKGLVKKFVGVSVDELVEMVDGEMPANDFAETVVEEGTKSALDGVEKLFDASVDALIEGFRRTETAMETFKDRLGNAIVTLENERRVPLFILVDELDRCRPTYAVELLERVKHLFDVDGVVFVFATNSDQLQHSIAGAYGPNFDGFRYLKRFFDRTYVFSEPRIEALVESICATLPKGKIRAPEDQDARRSDLTCGRSSAF